ncbi:MAG TPA: SRPBCC domain-containing protein, partial [Thermomicrobiales bacterium]|nr:SRPBCC domain-containing protein [Thermomicrobiales bacterium]
MSESVATETVVLDYELKSPIERVWNALTDSATLSKWMLFKTNDFKPVVGHAFQFRDAPGFDGTINCEVIEVDRPHRLSYTWVSDQVGPSNLEQSTVVTWTLTEAGGGITRLHLEQSGFHSGARQEIGGAKYGWKAMLD